MPPSVHWRGRLALASVVLAFLAVACGNTDGTDSNDGPLLVGILRSVPDDDHEAFVDELRTQGFSPGVDVVLVPDGADATYDDETSAETALNSWIRGGVDLVIAYSTPYARLAEEITDSTPVLFVVNDPVASGLVSDPEHPTGLLTGLSFRTPADRTLDLADRALGGIDTVGYLGPRNDAAVPGHRDAVIRAAAMLGLRVVQESFETGAVADAVQTLDAAGADVIYLANANGTIVARDEIRAALEEHDLPAIANTTFIDYAVVVLTPDEAQLRRQLARQAARLLDGAAVSSVPVEDPRKFTLIVNRTQLERFGIQDPNEDLLREADVVR